MHRAPSVSSHQGTASKRPTRFQSCSCGENGESSEEMSSSGAFNLVSGESQCSQLIADVGLHLILGSDSVNRNVFSLPIYSTTYQRSYQAFKPTTQISNKESYDLVYHSDCVCNFSSKITSQMCIWMGKESLSQVVVPRSSHPLLVANTRSIKSFINENPGLNLTHIFIHIGKFLSGSENVSNCGNCSTLIFGSTLRYQSSLLRSPLGLSHTLLKSFLSAIQFPSIRGNSISRLLQASGSSEDNQFHNDAQNDLMRQLVMESALYMYRLANSLLEGSTSLMLVTANNGLDFRIVLEDVQAPSQSPLYYMNEMRNHNYGDMWPDVDRMSYEELLALGDRIGYVSTGLSEEVAHTSLKHSKYFLLAEENAPKYFCSICQEDYVEEDELGTLDCGHSFHIACIKQWLGYKNICPICKSTELVVVEKLNTLENGNETILLYKMGFTSSFDVNYLGHQQGLVCEAPFLTVIFSARGSWNGKQEC
ncbi:hypothetical protein FNV43_RR03472 [Rhamnella rubrinervis]|uniref:RING-type E3 ubiquitin transferase n=1 Tax=Rhamnella rubrinervis TaxID=2594499 RepID=A0A8K0HIX8_9ROSA|nr:hypothetical protein FNV43_RR03472 [Rhamnella rubrinervis]